MGIDIVTLAMANSYTRNKIEEISLENGIQGPAGPKGEPGADGHTPVLGVDYFTDADKSEIVQSVLSQIQDGDGVSY